METSGATQQLKRDSVPKSRGPFYRRHESPRGRGTVAGINTGMPTGARRNKKKKRKPNERWNAFKRKPDRQKIIPHIIAVSAGTLGAALGSKPSPTEPGGSADSTADGGRRIAVGG